MITYAIQVGFSWGVLYLIYVCFLQKEPFFALNRFYLLSALIGSLFLPLIQIETSTDFAVGAVLLNEISIGAEQTVGAVATTSSWTFGNYLFAIYLLGVAFFITRLFLELKQLRKLYKSGDVLQKNGYYLVETQEEHSPFSFGKYLFINPTIMVNPEEYQYILNHEVAHIQQQHTFDIVLAELLQCIFWFNPLILLYKNALRDQHEYLADQAVLSAAPVKEYGQLLINQAVTGLHISVANHLIYSQLKKRINMMTKNHSSRVPVFKYALSVAAFVFSFWSVSCQQQASELAENTAPQTESQPYLASCKGSSTSEEIQQCSNLALMTFVAQNLKYPQAAKDKKVEGMAVISFVVNEKGLVDKVSIAKDLGEGCGEEAARIVKLMNEKNMTWVPAQKDGKTVATELKLPVRFKLQ